MLRTAIIRTSSVHRAQRLAVSAFGVRNMSASEGATGSGFSRPTGAAGGDSFTKREKATEDYYIRQKEREKLLELKKKLNQQRAHLDELDAHIEELTKNQGGEQN